MSLNETLYDFLFRSLDASFPLCYIYIYIYIYIYTIVCIIYLKGLITECCRLLYCGICVLY